MQSAAFQGGASCIKDPAAFSFDEPQANRPGLESGGRHFADLCNQAGGVKRQE
jgi:hypothetical protein